MNLQVSNLDRHKDEESSESHVRRLSSEEAPGKVHSEGRDEGEVQT